MTRRDDRHAGETATCTAYLCLHALHAFKQGRFFSHFATHSFFRVMGHSPSLTEKTKQFQVFTSSTVRALKTGAPTPLKTQKNATCHPCSQGNFTKRSSTHSRPLRKVEQILVEATRNNNQSRQSIRVGRRKSL